MKYPKGQMLNYIKYIAVFLLLLQYSSFATTYYVDRDNKLGNGSNNSWPGTINQPKYDFDNSTWFKDDLEPGDTVIVLQASHYPRMLMHSSSSGSAQYPIVIMPFPGDTIKFTSQTGGSTCFELYNVSYINFNGPFLMEDKTTPVVFNSACQGIKVNDLKITNCNRGMQLFGSIDCEFKDITITNVNEDFGVGLRGSTGTITGNPCQNLLFENVHVSDIDDGKIGPENSDADGFNTYFGEDIKFINCSVENSTEDGFDLNANAVLVNCTVNHIDGAGIKVWRRSPDNYAEKTVTLINCIIANCGYYAPNPDDGNPGIKVSEGAGLNVYNSVIYGVFDQGINLRFASSDYVYQQGWTYLPIHVYNTIIAHTLHGPGINDMHHPTQGNLVTDADYNLFYDNYQDVDGFTMGTHSIPGQDPLFADTTNFDFSVQSGSFAVNGGTDLTSDSLYNIYGQEDFDGVSRPSGSAVEIGAYECVACSSGTPPDPPDAPSNLSVSTGSSYSIDLSWTDNSDDEGQFLVERSPNGSTSWTQIGSASANSTTYTNNNLDCETTYYYRVKASNFGGSSSYSNTDNATTDECPITPPSPWQSIDIGNPLSGSSLYYSGSGLFFIEGDGTDIYGTEDHFRYVYQSLSGDGEISARVTDLENTNEWAKAGVMIRDSLTSTSKNFAMVMSADNGTSAQWRTNSAGVTDNVYDIDSYTPPYYVRVVRSGSTFTAYNSSNGTSWNQVADTTISMNTDVYIGLCVTSHNGSALCTGEFDNVLVNGVTSGPTSPSAPSNLTGASASESSIDLTWTDNSDDEDSFKIERSLDGSSGWTQIDTTASNDTTYTDTGLDCETVYYYRVRAYNTAGNSSYSSTTSDTTDSCPSGVSIIGSWISGLSHTAESGTNRLLIFTIHGKRDDATNTSVSTVTYGGQTMHKDAEKSYGPSNRLYVSIYALKESGISSASGSSFSVTWNTQPDYVDYASVFLEGVEQAGSYIGGASTNGATSSTVSTSALSSSSGDMVFVAGTCGSTGSYSVNNGFTEGIEVSPSTADGVVGYKSATGSNETPSITHSTNSDQAIVGLVIKYDGVTSGPTSPSAPSNLTGASASESSIDLTWTDNSDDEDSFKIERSLDGSSGWTQIDTTASNDTTYTDTGLDCETVYYYRVRAYNTAGNSSYSSTTSDTTDSCPSGVSIIGSWVSGLSHTAESGTNRLLIFTIHGKRDDATNTSVSTVTYGGQTMHKDAEKSYGPSNRLYVSIYALKESGISSASGSSFSVTWNTQPDYVDYASVFLEGVEQAGSYIGGASTNGATSSTVSTSALSSSSGDMVFVAGTCGSTGSYSVNNGFTEGIEVSPSTADGVVGYKSATGSNETPSITHSTNGDQAIVGLVIKYDGLSKRGNVELENDTEQLPEKFELYNAYPNPFNPTTNIRFDLPQNVTVKLSVYNNLGQLIKTIIPSRYMSKGRYQYIWNGKNDSNQQMSSGIYLISLQAGEYQSAKKIVLMK